MSRPFPTTPERKREAYAAMVREAPALMADIAALIKQFPGSRLTHFKAGDLELGDAPKDGWTVDESIRPACRAEASQARPKRIGK